jgi:hypothetical protein
MSSTANVRTVIARTLTACAIVVVALATAPTSTAATMPLAVGRHAYNPNAPRGSFDNPIISKGGSPMLTKAQRKALDQVKEQLASGKDKVKFTDGVQPGALNARTVVQPNFNNCGYSGFYYCNEVDTTIGLVAMGTVLDNNYHENAESMGVGRNSNNWATYMDQSRDGGKTWTPELRYVVNDPNAWSLPIYDGPGYYDRACIVDNQHGLYYCLPWH